MAKSSCRKSNGQIKKGCHLSRSGRLVKSHKKSSKKRR